MLTTRTDVFGSSDTKYAEAQEDERSKRNAIGVYQNSGLSQYTEPKPGVSYGTGANFPMNWYVSIFVCLG